MKDPHDILEKKLVTLRLPAIRELYIEHTKYAVAKGLGHIDYLARLIEAEAEQRKQRSIQRRIRATRFPYIKTLDEYDFTYPTKIDRMKINDIFTLKFLDNTANVIIVGPTGMGKTHLAIALGYHACHQEVNTLFTSAIDMLNHLTTAQATNKLERELRRYTKPALLLIDELGYLPIDKKGADLLFQVISARYERGSIVLTTNRIFKEWAQIFNNDATLTSAVLDRIVHHHQLIIIQGNSYRMRTPNE
jgi:DNA replication protein DnaC